MAKRFKEIRQEDESLKKELLRSGNTTMPSIAGSFGHTVAAIVLWLRLWLKAV